VKLAVKTLTGRYRKAQLEDVVEAREVLCKEVKLAVKKWTGHYRKARNFEAVVEERDVQCKEVTLTGKCTSRCNTSNVKEEVLTVRIGTSESIHVHGKAETSTLYPIRRARGREKKRALRSGCQKNVMRKYTGTTSAGGKKFSISKLVQLRSPSQHESLRDGDGESGTISEQTEGWQGKQISRSKLRKLLRVAAYCSCCKRRSYRAATRLNKRRGVLVHLPFLSLLWKTMSAHFEVKKKDVL
jgi:hypothetical protein